MTDEKMQYGTAEAFSFRKGVVKISGRWIRFGPEAVNSIRVLSVGDTVGYITGNGTLKSVQKSQAGQHAAASPAATAPVKAQIAPPAPATGRNPAFEDRNRSIERQVALKAAVELAERYGYRSTKECLDVAATFAAWIESGRPEDVQLPQKGAGEIGREGIFPCPLPSF